MLDKDYFLYELRHIKLNPVKAEIEFDSMIKK